MVDPQREAELWAKYYEGRATAARNALVDLYMAAVRATARVVKASFAKRSITLDADDLASYGAIGVMAAIERFDPSLGLKFLTFAQTRIRGAMIDAVRQHDWVPRAERRARADTPAVLSADLAQEQVDVSAARADEAMSVLDCQEELAALLDSLTAKQRRVFQMHVIDGESDTRTAVAMRVTPAYVWRVRELAERRLRKFLGVRATDRATPPACLPSAA